MSKEAQTIFSRYTDWPSSRVDVPTDIITPARVRQEGVEYFNPETEQFQQKKEMYQKTAEEIFAELIK